MINSMSHIEANQYVKECSNNGTYVDGKQYAAKLLSEKYNNGDIKEIDGHRFRFDPYYKNLNYESCKDMKIGEDLVEVRIQSSPGKEQKDISKINNFLKGYSTSKAKDGLVKEYYDGECSDNWLDEYEISKNEFKKMISLEAISFDPKKNTYVACWDDGGSYGGHLFVDEGSMNNYKVKRRDLFD